MSNCVDCSGLENTRVSILGKRGLVGMRILELHLSCMVLFLAALA